jgi:hypothetical protein
VVRAEALGELDCSLNRLLTHTEALGGCGRLTNLTLTGCAELVDVSGLCGLAQLSHLYLSGCTSLSDVSPLRALGALSVLHLSKCPRLADAAALGECPRLELLNLRCSGVRVVPCRAGLRVLFDSEPGGQRHSTVGVL